MASIYHFRNKKYCMVFLIFQIIFVAIQVVIFYPCWQNKPSSDVSNGKRNYNVVNQVGMRFHPPQESVHSILSGLEQQRLKAEAAIAKTGEVIKSLVKESAGHGKISPIISNEDGEHHHSHQQLASTVNVNPMKDTKTTQKHTYHANVGANSNTPHASKEAALLANETAKLKTQRVKMQGLEEQRAVQQGQLKVPNSKYNTSWASLDSRPNPQWYDAGKIGIFIHWGVFSVPSFSVANGLAEWFWFYWKNEQFVKPLNEIHRHRFDGFIEKKANAIKGVKEYAAKMYGRKWRYTDFASEFKAEFFDAKQWADVFKESGANYVVLTSKHHDGFALWPSKRSWNWNSVDVGPHRDIVGELGKAVKEAGLHYGLYHSLYEWFNPKYTHDKANGFTTQTFIREKMMPELKYLVTTYLPDVVWSDGQFEAPCSYWNCTEFIAWLYNESPVKDTVVTNDRWGDDVLCKHGGYLTCADRYNPRRRKWENAMTIDRESWGYRRNAVLKDYYTMEGLVEVLAQTVSKGGNLLMNIGPTADGRIPPIFEERLKQLGGWLRINGEGIYHTTAWHTSTDTTSKHVYYTQKSTADGPVVFAVLLRWPDDGLLHLASPQPSTQTRVTWLGYRGEPLGWQQVGGWMLLTLPPISMAHIPCQWGWVFRITNLLNAVI